LLTAEATAESGDGNSEHAGDETRRGEEECMLRKRLIKAYVVCCEL
jgi:hypothetical protein